MLQGGYLHQNGVKFHNKVFGPIVNLATPTFQTQAVQKFMSSHIGKSIRRFPIDVVAGKHFVPIGIVKWVISGQCFLFWSSEIYKQSYLRSRNLPNWSHYVVAILPNWSHYVVAILPNWSTYIVAGLRECILGRS